MYWPDTQPVMSCDVLISHQVSLPLPNVFTRVTESPAVREVMTFARALGRERREMFVPLMMQSPDDCGAGGAGGFLLEFLDEEEALYLSEVQ